MELEQTAAREFDRRQVLKILGLGAAGIALESCASLGAKFPEDAYFRANPRILADYVQHYWPPRGIDFLAGYGVPVTSPVVGYVTGTTIHGGQHIQGKGTNVVIDTDLGHQLNISGLSRVYVSPNDHVTPFTIIGEEGDDAPTVTGRPELHTHVGLSVPFFAELFNKGYERYKNRSSGVENLIDNPHSHSANGSNLLTSAYAGDNSRIEQLTKEAEQRFDAIGQKYADTHLGWFINESKKEARFFPRVFAAYKMLKNGLINNEEVEKALMDYLEWHSNLKVGLFLSYPNYDLRSKYVVPNSDQERWDKLNKVWDPIRERIDDAFRSARDGTIKPHTWENVAAELEKWREMAPISGERSFHIYYGIAKRLSGHPKKGIIHLLMGEGLMDYRLADRKQGYMGAYDQLSRAYNTIGLKRESEIFKRKYEALRNSK